MPIRNDKRGLGGGSIIAIVGAVIVIMLLVTAMGISSNTFSNLPGASNDTEQPFNYIIFKPSNALYAAKNCTSGRIDCAGTNASEVIQYAIDSFPALKGGTIYIKAGTYLITYPISIQHKNSLVLTGDYYNSLLKLDDNANCNIIEMYENGYCLFEKLYFDGNMANNYAGNCIVQVGGIDMAYRDLTIHNAPDHGLVLQGYMPPTVTIALKVLILDNVYVGNSRNSTVYAYSVGDGIFTGCVAEVPQNPNTSAYEIYGSGIVFNSCYAELNAIYTDTYAVSMNASVCQFFQCSFMGRLRTNLDQGSSIFSCYVFALGTGTPITITNKSGGTWLHISGGTYDITPPISIDSLSAPIVLDHVQRVTNTASGHYYFNGTVTPIATAIIAHGLDWTPSWITIHQFENGTQNTFWVTNINSTSFTLHRYSGAGWNYVDWHCEVFT